MQRLFAVVGILLFVAACSSNAPPQSTPAGQPIPTALSSGLVSNLAAQVTSLGLTGPSALWVEAASLALQAGVQATPVTLTAGSLVASSPTRADAPSHSGALAGGQGGAGYAFAFQLTIINSPQGASTQMFTGVMFFADENNFAVAAATGVNAIAGLLVSGATQVWLASAGQESAEPGAVAGACPISPAAYLTLCNQATFANAGFNITASTPFGDATASEAASLPNTTLAGAELTIDCSKTSLCGYVGSGSNFAGYWDGPFSIPNLSPSSGTAYVLIDAGTSNQLFINSPNFLCPPKNPDPRDAGPEAILATQTSPTTFVIVPTYSLADGGPPPCALPYSTCPQVPYGSLSVAGGTGLLSNGELFITFDGGTFCDGGTTVFSGTYGPGVNQNGE